MEVDYKKLHWRWKQHHERYERYVELKHSNLWCMECKGAGGGTEFISLELGGPWNQCGWCEGTGLMTSYLRGAWLRMMKQEKAKRRQKEANDYSRSR